jgi:hypothetical protein
MYYKAIKTNTILHSNADGKSDTVRPIIGVGMFEKEDSQTYILICRMEKFGSDEEQYQEADRIATLLNKNTKYITQKEAELKGLQLP